MKVPPPPLQQSRNNSFPSFANSNPSTPHYSPPKYSPLNQDMLSNKNLPSVPPHVHKQQSSPGVQVFTNDVSNIRFCCGLDFGTTYSGFAIVQMHTNYNNLQPITPLTWPDQPPNVTGVKTPTICCYNKTDMALDSWGFTAMKKNTMKVHKIERVKLCLEPTTPEYLKPNIPIGLNADQIICDYLRELNTYCLRTMEQVYGVFMDRGDIQLDEIMYCLTVPVNWSVESHQRLRKAAFNAGLISTEESPNLVFCYEPEAACLACIHDPDVKLPPGAEFLVVDCGGGTVDLFQCRINGEQASNKSNSNQADARTALEVSELTMGHGGFFGASNVDIAFFMYLSEIMSPLGFENVQHSPKCAPAWNNLLSQWEYRKRQFTGLETSIDEIFIPQAILRELQDTLDTGEMSDMLMSGTIELDPDRMRSFFDPVLDSIIHLIQSQIRLLVEIYPQKNATIPVLEHMFVVGGFGNSAYLRKRISEDPVISKSVHRIRSIPSPEVAVLRGAVYAAVGDCIRSRRARQSIGVQILLPFDPKVHTLTDIVYKSPTNPTDQSLWLVDCYVEPFIHAGEPVVMSSYYTKHHFSLSPGSMSADINLYTSNATHPILHITKDACTFLGRVTIDASVTPLSRSGTTSTLSTYVYDKGGSSPYPKVLKMHDSSMAKTKDLSVETDLLLDTDLTLYGDDVHDYSIAIFYGRVEVEVCVTDTRSGHTWRTILGHGHIHLR